MALVSDEWEIPWQPRHQVLVRLAEYFHVVWCTPAPWWRTWRLRGVARQERDDYGPPLAPGLTIYRPESWLPEVGRPRLLAHWTRQQRLSRAQRILLNGGSGKIVLYLWRPSFEPALDLVNHDLSCYHIDDEYTFSEVEKPLDACEARLIARVDQVFIHSPALLEKKGKLNPRTAFVPNGVDYCAYATPHNEPADLAPIRRPRIGYVGRIKRQLDLDLLIALARRHQDWSFVFVGPQSGIDGHAALLQELSQMPNVYFLGDKPVDALPAYTQHLDVCLLCYAVNDYTKFIYPLKLHEYLASGRPVVGSPIRSLLEFAHIIRLARTTDEWSQALNDSLAAAASSVARVEARLSIARQHDWDRLVRLIAHTLCDRLGPEYVERFEQIPFRDQTVTSTTR
jgi:glycosyltransferase involved in cell wall biosynthesis